MGRRSINTTKSGKYMNPTDQARKEARKKELKKNKKQRQMVRAAVLKGKDPHQIIEEMEKIDQMEYNVLQPSPLNEKVLKDKRKKLRDTLDRVLKMYNKDDPQKWVELKRSQAEYEKRRNQMITFYESVKHAQSVSVDEIPLPAIQIPENIPAFNNNNQQQPAQIPLPQHNQLTTEQSSPPKPASILKRTTAYAMSLDKEPPGVPPGPPPDLSDASSDEEDDENAESRPKTLRFSDDVNAVSTETDDESDKEMETEEINVNINNAPPTNKPTSLQQRMVQLSGQNIDDFMKEMEAVHKKESGDKNEIGENNKKESSREDSREILIPPGTDPLEQLPQMMPPSSTAMMYRAPPPMVRPVMPLMGLRLPPGPPPGRPNLPPGPPPGLPPRPNIRMPPGPPPGIPPRFIRPILPIMQTQPNLNSNINSNPNLPSGVNPNVLSAAPQLINRDGKQSATIMAKPQIRNLSADVTRFVPSALRVKREDNKKKNVTRAMLVHELKQQEIQSTKPQNTGTKDDAYKQFMREMEGLL